MGLRPKPAHRRPMTLPLCRGNHWAGVVRVTSITQFRARQFISPYTVYKLPSPALARVCRYCRYSRYCRYLLPGDHAGPGEHWGEGVEQAAQHQGGPPAQARHQHQAACTTHTIHYMSPITLISYNTYEEADALCQASVGKYHGHVAIGQLFI